MEEAGRRYFGWVRKERVFPAIFSFPLALFPSPNFLFERWTKETNAPLLAL
jgi:hypothetical protein